MKPRGLSKGAITRIARSLEYFSDTIEISEDSIMVEIYELDRQGAYFRIQPAGKSLDHKSVDYTGEGLAEGVYAFANMEEALADLWEPDSYATIWGTGDSELVAIMGGYVEDAEEGFVIINGGNVGSRWNIDEIKTDDGVQEYLVFAGWLDL